MLSSHSPTKPDIEENLEQINMSTWRGRDAIDKDDESNDKVPLLPVSTSPPLDQEPLNFVKSHGKVSSAVFYAVASLWTVFVMKIVLTSYGFPSSLFLGLCQVDICRSRLQ